MISYKIRIGRDEDNRACIRLSRISWPDWWSENERLGKKHIRNCIHNKRCLVAVKDKEVIAFMVWGVLWNKIHLQDIFVEKEYRRCGIGSNLVQHLIKISKKEGFKEITSDSDVANKVALIFHLKNGFKRRGLIRNNWDNASSYVYAMKFY